MIEIFRCFNCSLLASPNTTIFSLFDYLHNSPAFQRFDHLGVLLSHDFLDPRHKLLDVGVHPGQMLPSASDPPGHQPDQRLAAIQRQRQWSTGVPLAAITTSLLVTGTQEHIVDNLTPTCRPEPPLASLVRYHLHVNFLPS